MKVPSSGWFFFSLKSIVTSNLNHSNRIRNEQVRAKILTLFQNRALGIGTGTGTG